MDGDEREGSFFHPIVLAEPDERSGPVLTLEPRKAGFRLNSPRLWSKNMDSIVDLLRRMGRPVVQCHQCDALMDEPDDPFEGPAVLWIDSRAPEEGELFFVCSTGCRKTLRARLKAAGGRS